MATYTFYPSTSNSAWFQSFDTSNSYTKARAGTGSPGVSYGTGNATTYVGQSKSGAIYTCYETLLDFDTSSLSGKTITSATLSIYPTTLANAGGSWTNEARLYDYGTSLSNADYVAGANIGSYTSLATLTSAASTTGAYRAFTDVALPANINKTGKTRIGIFSSEQRLNSAPTGQEYVGFDGDSGTNPPKLVVVTSDEGGLTATIAAITLSSTISIETAGVLDGSIGAIGFSAAGETTTAGTGLLDKTIDAITVSSAISIETFAYLEIEMDPITLNTAALVDLNGVLSQTIDNVSLSSIVAPDATGTLSTSIGPVTLQTSTQGGIQGDLSTSIGSIVLSATQSGAAWPSVYLFPQEPLDGTWRRVPGDDTLRSDRTPGARQYRSRNGGNYADATFAIMLRTKAQRDELDRFFRDDCKHGTRPFNWPDPETDAVAKWTWANAPALQHIAGETYRVECALRREAA